MPPFGPVKRIFTVNIRPSRLLTTVVAAISLMIAACSSTRTPPPVKPETVEATTTPTDAWSGLLQLTPYPYTTPLPPTRPTALDGIYTKFDPRQGRDDSPPEGGAPPKGGVWMPHPRREGVFWLKPVPYPLEGGGWTLQLDGGVFRVFHKATGWRTLGSFTVSEERITFFNDPHCYDAVGVYRWQLEAGQLELEVIEDECDGRVLGGGGLRAMNLAGLPWLLDGSGMDG